MISVASCFNKCLKLECDSTNFISEILESQKKLSYDDFLSQFIECIKHLLLLPIKSSDVVQLIDTIIAYLTCEEMISITRNENDNISKENVYFNATLLMIVESILSYHNSESKQVRQNVCYILEKLLEKIPFQLMDLLLSHISTISNNTTTNMVTSMNSTSIQNTTQNLPNNISNLSATSLSIIGNKDHSNIDEAVKLCNKIKQYLIVRLSDKVTCVRLAAINALKWLQYPNDVNCPVVNAFINCLQYDLCAEIRLLILNCIKQTNQTIPHILKRVFDIKHEVKEKALNILSENISIKVLSISDRIRLVNYILNNPAPNTDYFMSAAQSLLRKWIVDCDKSFIRLIQLLDPETYEDTIDQLFRFCFTSILTVVHSNYGEIYRSIIIDEIKTHLDQDTKLLTTITCESTYLWYIVVKYQDFFNSDFDIITDHILPELSKFCVFLEEYIENNMKFEACGNETSVVFILKKLIALTTFMDLNDEIGRKSAYTLFLKLLSLKHIPLELICDIVKALIYFSVSSTTTIENVIEVISDHLKPLTALTNDQSVLSTGSHYHSANSSLNNDNLPNENDITKNQNVSVKTRMESLDVKSTEELQLELANIRFQLMTIKNDIDDAISRQDFYNAAELKQKFDQIDHQKHRLIEQLMNTNQSFRDNAQAVKDAIMLPKSNVCDTNEGAILMDRSKAFQADNAQNHVDGDDDEDELRLDDPSTVIRCLIINSELMKQLKLRELTTSQQTLFHSLILPSIQNIDPLVRNEAVLNLGLYSIRSREIAHRYLLLLLQILQMDCENVQLTAISASFDILLAFGTKFLDQKLSDDPNLTPEDVNSDQLNTISSILNILLNFLDHDSCNIHNLVAEGMAKLLLLDRVRSSELLSKLILVWHNPNNSTNEKLRKTLGLFFPIFASASKKNQELFDDAALPTLKAICDAPDMSPLSEIKINIVVDFFVELTSPRYYTKVKNNEFSDVNLHDSLAFKILNEILQDDTDVDYIRVLSKFLTQLQISTQNDASIKSLKLLYDKAANKTKDKIANRYLDKFGVFVNSLAAANNLSSSSNTNSQECLVTIEKQSTATITSKSKLQESSENIENDNSKLFNSKDITALNENEQRVVIDASNTTDQNDDTCVESVLPKPKLSSKKLSITKKINKKFVNKKKIKEKNCKIYVGKTRSISNNSESQNISNQSIKSSLLSLGDSSRKRSVPKGFDVSIHLQDALSTNTTLQLSTTLNGSSSELTGDENVTKEQTLSSSRPKRKMKKTEKILYYHDNKKLSRGDNSRKKRSSIHTTNNNHQLSASEKPVYESKKK